MTDNVRIASLLYNNDRIFVIRWVNCLSEKCGKSYHCMLEWKKRFYATKETNMECNCMYITYLYLVGAHMFLWLIYICLLVAGYPYSNRRECDYLNRFHAATFCACSNPWSSISRFEL